jgi:predicted Zn-dependent protease
MRPPGWAWECPETTRARRVARLCSAAGALLVCLALIAPALAHEAIDRQIADLDARIAAHPGDASLYLVRGERHRVHADWNAAARDYRRAREIDPGLDAVDLCFGRLHLEGGDPARAVRSLDRFLQRHPGHPDALAVRARALARLGRNLDAAHDLTQAIEARRATGPPDPDLFLERARLLAGAPEPRLEDALRGLDEGLRTLGPVVGLGFYAIDLEMRLGRFDAALHRLDRLAAMSPRKESYLVRRAAIFEAAARPDEARRAYEDALAAIAALPAERRGARAVHDLETTARSGLARLAVPAGRAGSPGPRAETR